MSETPFRMALRTYEPQTERHTHHYAQTIIPLRGVMEIEIDGRGARLAPNTAAVLPPGAVHDFECTRDGRFLIFDVSDDKLIDTCMATGRRPVRRITPAAWRYMRFLAGEAELGDSQVLRSSTALATALELLADAEDSARPAPPPRPRLEAASRRLTEQACMPLNMADLAREAGLSASRFHRLYRDTYGQSPKQAQIDARLRRAVDLLLTTGQSVSAIAYDLGYENVSSFTNLFKRRFGMTPGAFRARER